MKKRTTSLLLATLILTGCTSENSGIQIKKTIEEGGAYTPSTEESTVVSENDNEVIEDNTKSESKVDSNVENKLELPPEYQDIIDSSKILSKHKIEIETTNMKETFNSIEREIHKINGYVSSNKTEKGKTTSEISIKFPASKSAEIKKFLKDNFEIVSEETEAIDISSNFYDLESRIKGLEERENRLKETYDISANVEEILLIDKKMFEVIVEKEELLRQKLKIENRENFSKIDIKFKKVKKIESQEEPSVVAKEFKNSINVIKDFLSKALILLIKVIPAVFFSLGMGAILSLILYIKFHIKYKLKKQKQL